jgi:hypothetical protein
LLVESASAPWELPTIRPRDLTPDEVARVERETRRAMRLTVHADGVRALWEMHESVVDQAVAFTLYGPRSFPYHYLKAVQHIARVYAKRHRTRLRKMLESTMKAFVK